MILLDGVLRKLGLYNVRRGVQRALALHRRGEARRDGLALIYASHRLEIGWCARNLHPWDRDSEPEERDLLFAEQAIRDTDAALSRLFTELRHVDVIEFKVIHPDTKQQILAGTVERAAPAPRTRGVSPRTRLWHQGVTVAVIAMLAILLASPVGFGQAPAATASPDAQSSSTSTDLFVMIGSDLDRPGALPRANYNIGIGHTFGFLKKDPIGDELTFSYTYENAGTHGFLHTQYGEHTETFGVMKNFSIPKAKSLGGYTWLQMGPTTYTGFATLQTHLYSGAALGLVIHFNDHNGIWMQESYNKVVTVPWYTTSSIGYTYSW